MPKHIIPIALCAIILSSCAKAKEDISEIKQRTLSELASRNVSAGMTMDEVKAAETLPLAEDTTDAHITPDSSARYLSSTDTIDYNGYDAIVTYFFMDNALCGITYDLNVEYTLDNYKTDGILYIYDKYKLDLTDLYGTPTECEDKAYYPVDILDFYTSMWVDAEKDDAMIGMYATISPLDTISRSEEPITDVLSISYYLND